MVEIWYKGKLVGYVLPRAISPANDPKEFVKNFNALGGPRKARLV